MSPGFGMKGVGIYEGGVNHYLSFTLSFGEFLCLMRRGKYGAVIGLKEPITRKYKLGTYKNRRFPTNHSAVFSTEFRQTTV